MTLPLPRLVTFYIGTEDIGDKVLYLSDSFPKGSDAEQSDVEVKVHLYNICPRFQSPLLSVSKPLAEYSWFIEEIYRNRRTMDMTAAMNRAIREMPVEYEIKSFLVEHQSEVKSMLLTEYDEAETMAMFKEEGRKEGLAAGADQKLIRLICRKLRKKKSPSEIAEALEEDATDIQKICDTLSAFAPDYEEDRIIGALWPEQRMDGRK